MIEKAKFAIRFYTCRSQTQNDDVCVFFMNNGIAASETDSAKSEEQVIHTAKKALTCLDTHLKWARTVHWNENWRGTVFEQPASPDQVKKLAKEAKFGMRFYTFSKPKPIMTTLDSLLER